MKKVKLTGYRLYEYGTIDRQPATGEQENHTGKSGVISPSWPYLSVLGQSPKVSKLLAVWNHRSVSR